MYSCNLPRCDGTVVACMNTTNITGAVTLTELAAEYKKAANEKMTEIVHLSVVSQDTACREGYNLQALRRAQEAAETGNVFLSGNGVKGVLVLGISALGFEKAKSFIASCGGWKSHANSALLCLDGEKGEIRKNKAGTCWVIDLASPRDTTLFAWTSGPGDTQLAGPRLNTTNGAAHWCGLVSASMEISADKAPVAMMFIKRAVACLAEHGMTPRQWEKSENARITAENNRHIAIIDAARKAAQADGASWSHGGYGPQWGEEYREAAFSLASATSPIPENLAELVREKIAKARLIAEEAQIMAHLEAEQAKLVADRIMAEDQAKQEVAIEVTCKAAGISLVAWQGMTLKQQRLALHRTRLAGRI